MHFKNAETNIQVAIVNYIKWKYPHVLFTIAPSGMKLPGYVGAMLKAMGYRAGTPDLLIFEPRGTYHGLLLEVKTEEGKLTKPQVEFMDKADQKGYKTYCCYGYNAAIDAFEMYLNM